MSDRNLPATREDVQSQHSNMSPNNKCKKLKSDQRLDETPSREVSQVGFPCSSRNWTASFVDAPRPTYMLQFDDYCRFRSSMQMQLLINNKQTEVFGADDKMFASLILMEQQYQYSRRIASFQTTENGSFGDIKFQKNRRRFTQKKKIKKYEGKPKKPLTSFMLYLRDFRKALESNPSPEKILPNEINKLAGKQWHLLPNNIRLGYKEEANKALENWQKENFQNDGKKSGEARPSSQHSNAATTQLLEGQKSTDGAMKIEKKDEVASSETASSGGYSSSDESSGSETA